MCTVTSSSFTACGSSLMGLSAAMSLASARQERADGDLEAPCSLQADDQSLRMRERQEPAADDGVLHARRASWFATVHLPSLSVVFVVNNATPHEVAAEKEAAKGGRAPVVLLPWGS